MTLHQNSLRSFQKIFDCLLTLRFKRVMCDERRPLFLQKDLNGRPVTIAVKGRVRGLINHTHRVPLFRQFHISLSMP